MTKSRLGTLGDRSNLRSFNPLKFRLVYIVIYLFIHLVVQIAKETVSFLRPLSYLGSSN